MGARLLGAGVPGRAARSGAAAREPGERPVGPAARGRGLLLLAGLLGAARDALCLAARLLVALPAGLDLGAVPLRLDTAGLHLRRWLLGLSAASPRPAVR